MSMFFGNMSGFNLNAKNASPAPLTKRQLANVNNLGNNNLNANTVSLNTSNMNISPGNFNGEPLPNWMYTGFRPSNKAYNTEPVAPPPKFKLGPAPGSRVGGRRKTRAAPKRAPKRSERGTHGKRHRKSTRKTK